MRKRDIPSTVAKLWLLLVGWKFAPAAKRSILQVTAERLFSGSPDESAALPRGGGCQPRTKENRVVLKIVFKSFESL